MNATPPLRGLVFDIKRDCSEDGPGIRTTVFFKGCPLHCVWCQNPEGQGDKPKDGCFPESSQPSLALGLEGVGRWYELEELLYHVLIDRPFFQSTGGGVTVSGGEPTFQMNFMGEFLKRLHQEGVDTAIETCGFFHYASFEKRVLPYLNRIYFDLKIMDDAEHRRLTGQSNLPILDNLTRLANETILPLNVRVPLIPGMTATAENLSAIGQFLREHGIEDVTLLPYNPLWQDKLGQLGLSSPQLSCGFMTPEQLAGCACEINKSV